MFLLLWGIFLTIMSTLISPITQFLVSISCTITEYEIEVRKEIKNLKQELSEISMMEEFASYARTERKINQLEEKLVSFSSGRKIQSNKASWAIKISLHSILGLMTMMTVWSYWGQPVVSLQPEWVWPVGWFLSSPGVYVAGGVSFPSWLALCRTSLQMMPKVPNILPKANYAQLPLD